LTKQALVAGGPRQRGKATFTMTINGKEAAEGQVTEDSADVLQPLDLPGRVRAGPDEVTVEVRGETGLMCQVVGRHFEPHRAEPPALHRPEGPCPSPVSPILPSAVTIPGCRGQAPFRSRQGSRDSNDR
jgi:hypothetical protein